MISYEVSLGLILVVTLLCVGSLNLVSIVSFQAFVFFIIPFFPLFLMFLVSILAETNRAPFDLPEAESELVSGFNVEYASMGFALFSLCGGNPKNYPKWLPKSSPEGYQLAPKARRGRLQSASERVSKIDIEFKPKRGPQWRPNGSQNPVKI